MCFYSLFKVYLWFFHFYSMQLVLRSITTTLGNFWEELATLSNNSISTEKEFGIKIKGVDIICIDNNNIIKILIQDYKKLYSTLQLYIHTLKI